MSETVRKPKTLAGWLFKGAAHFVWGQEKELMALGYIAATSKTPQEFSERTKRLQKKSRAFYDKAGEIGDDNSGLVNTIVGGIVTGQINKQS